MTSNKQNSPLVTPKIRQARIATFAGFMLLGALFYTWSVGVTAFRNHLGLSGSLGDMDFGMLALGIAVGAAFGAFLVGYAVDYFSPRAVLRILLIGYPVSFICLAVVPDYWFAMVFACILGFLRGATDTALNAHGVEVERYYERPIMSSFHAFFSLGGFLFGFIASYLAGFSTESAIIPFTTAGVSLAIFGLITSKYMLGKNDLLPVPALSAPSAASSSQMDWRVLFLMIVFGFILIAGMIGESSVSDWGQEFMHRERGMDITHAGMAISLYTGAGFIARLTGDWLAARIGRASMLFLSCVVSIVGMLCATLSKEPSMSVLGCLLLGAGLACIAPLMLGAAGQKDPANAGRNVGIVNGIGFFGMLGGPAIYSLIITAYGIEALFYLPLVLMAIVTLIAPLSVRAKPAQEHSKNMSYAAR
ncbi:MFS transporter [Pseudomonas kurunegalensis]|uniref:MFS transporter n=1 Tax=Pseudomonas kurunegalensis TaxID=485880 RepID=UPI0023645F93|nr:MFS transporter [Pseudomonas kurunegalensis]MDD2134537.1 MFS transporter [Pseudomonas kurunegalensis]